MKFCFSLVFSLAICYCVSGQKNRYWIGFKDKDNSLYSTTQPERFLTDGAIARRAKNRVVVSEQDLPVNASYIAVLKQQRSFQIFYTLKWFNGVVAEVDAAQIDAIKTLPFVREVTYLAPPAKPLATTSTAYIDNIPDTNQNAVNLYQLQSLGLDKMQKQGIAGAGVKVAIFDGGFLNVDKISAFDHLRQENRLHAWNIVNKEEDVYARSSDHGTRVLSLIAAQTTEFIGGAPNADFYLFLTEDVNSEYIIEEYNWARAAEMADSLGIDVISSSLGYLFFDDAATSYVAADIDGKTAFSTRAATQAAARGIMVVVSAGNAGASARKWIFPPADGDGIIAVGGVGRNNQKTATSSTGPTADGRIKPDIAAYGYQVAVIAGNGNVTLANGTSFAAPLAASLIIGLIEKFSTDTCWQIYDKIIRSATQNHHPDNLIGYGVPSFDKIYTVTAIAAEPLPVTLFPNPVSGKLYARAETFENEPITLTVINIFGQKVTFEVLAGANSHTAVFDVASWPSGPYIVRINYKNQIHREKIIICH